MSLTQTKNASEKRTPCFIRLGISRTARRTVPVPLSRGPSAIRLARRESATGTKAANTLLPVESATRCFGAGRSFPTPFHLDSLANASLRMVMVGQFMLLLAIQCIAKEPEEIGKDALRKPIPDKLVVLTFDDSAKSHFTVVRPLLKQYGFSGTFFITEGFDFPTNKKDYMTWEEIAQLHKDGFEIGNHTRDHRSITDNSYLELTEQLAGIEKRCHEHGIPKPTTFAWPGNSITAKAFATLTKHGILFARRGGAPEYPYEAGLGFAYEPGIDHPLLLPSAGDARPDWTLDDLVRAVKQARNGKIAILQFHGAPDTAHSWVNTPKQNFEAFMKYLAVNEYKVIAVRDLAEYVDVEVKPKNAMAVIQQRQDLLAAEGTKTK